MAVVVKRKGESTQYFNWSRKDYSKYFQVISKRGQEEGEENTGERIAHPIIQHTLLTS